MSAQSARSSGPSKRIPTSLHPYSRRAESAGPLGGKTAEDRREGKEGKEGKAPFASNQAVDNRFALLQDMQTCRAMGRQPESDEFQHSDEHKHCHPQPYLLFIATMVAVFRACKPPM